MEKQERGYSVKRRNQQRGIADERRRRGLKNVLDGGV
jgi:hypothetical protein